MTIDKTNLDVYVPLWQAARDLDLNMDQIEEMVQAGKLAAAIMTDGSIGISSTSMQALSPRESLPEYQQYSNLQRVPISINAGARKYQLNTSTLTRWMQRGLIHQIGTDKNRTLLDEAEVAFCADIYHRNQGQGRRTFDVTGKPYLIPK